MIQLGPLGLKKGIKRIKNLLVEEISLVDSSAIRRRFLLIKRGSQEKDSVFLEKLDSTRRISSMELDEKLEDGETMIFERDEELTLPPDVVRTLKLIIGQLSKLIGYKTKVKYKYEKPTEKKSEEEPEKEIKSTTEEIQTAKAKAKETDKTKEKKVELEEKEVSKEIADALADLSKIVDSDVELDVKGIQEKIEDTLEKLKAGPGGEKE